MWNKRNVAKGVRLMATRTDRIMRERRVTIFGIQSLVVRREGLKFWKRASEGVGRKRLMKSIAL